MQSFNQMITEIDSLTLWDTSLIVKALRALRNRSLAQRQRESRPPRLPSRKALESIVESLSTVLYPNRLGAGDIAPEHADRFVDTRLRQALDELVIQIERELRFTAEQSSGSAPDTGQQSVNLTRRFAATLPDLREVLDSDLQAAFEGDPAARSVDEVLVCYPGIIAVTCHRLAHELFCLGLPLIARMIAEIAHSVTGIDIHPGAEIGGSFFIDHGTGVVIGETAVIGRRVRLYQAVTLGAKRFPTDENGVLLKGNARHPIVEDDVVIYAGATILGRITIGRGSTIGGNVWLTRSVPPDSNITQAQARQEGFIHGAGI
ncbi:MAG: serine O-acetyltransferase EpsC [Methylococcaceae bacterium]|jgi:serine O-acetyltransferase